MNESMDVDVDDAHRLQEAFNECLMVLDEGGVFDESAKVSARVFNKMVATRETPYWIRVLCNGALWQAPLVRELAMELKMNHEGYVL